MTNSLQLLVRGIEGRTIIVPQQANITPQSKIIDVKNFLFKKQGIQTEDQRLIFAAKELRDQNLVKDYHIINNSNLTMAVRLRGGVKTIILKVILANDNQFKIQISLKASVFQLKSQIEKLDDFLTAEKMALHYRRNQYLENDKRVEEYKFDDNDVLMQSKEDIKNQENIELSFEPDVVTLQDDQNLPRAKMPCGHAISTQSMTQLLRSLITNRLYKIKCPGHQCKAHWDYNLCRKIGVLTKEQMKEFELAIEQSYATSKLGMKQCIYCQSFLFKPQDISQNRVECTGCYFKNKKTRTICWTCMKQWKVIDSQTNLCGNKDCGVKQLNQILRTCKDKSMMSKGKIPECRACPNCKTLIHHIDGCQIMNCTNCKSIFCFCCLKIGKCNYQTPCEVAPRQKF